MCARDKFLYNDSEFDRHYCSVMYYFLGLKLSNYKQCRHQTAPNSNEFLLFSFSLFSFFLYLFSFLSSLTLQLYSLNYWKPLCSVALLCEWESGSVCVWRSVPSKWPLVWEWPRSDVVIVEPLYKNCYVSVYHIYFESQCHPSALWGQKQKKMGGWSMIH